MWITRSTDGTQFEPATLLTERAGVPCVIQDKTGRYLAVFQWFPLDTEHQAYFDKVAVMISEDGQTWLEPQPVQIQGFPSNLQRPYDPTLVVLPDGRFRLYYTSHLLGQPGGEIPVSAFFSAISSDGIHYQFEEGIRFGVEGKRLFDCAVLQLGEQWHLCAPAGRPEDGALHAISTDGLNFTQATTIPSVNGVNWTGNLVAVQNGMRFYGTSSGRGSWWSFSEDGFQWTAPTFTNTMGGDPGIVTMGNQLTMIYVGPDTNKITDPRFVMRSPASGLEVNTSATTQLEIEWMVLPNQTVLTTQTLTLVENRNGALVESLIASGLSGNVRRFMVALPAGKIANEAYVEIEAVDSTGREITGRSGTFSIGTAEEPPPPDTQSPVITNVTLSKTRVKRKVDPELVIGWQSSDNVGVQSHDLRYASDAVTFSTVIVSGLAGNAQTFSWTVPRSLPKTSTGVIQVQAKDAAGNSSQAKSVTVRIK
ncbi:MAG: hypothetical protein HY774_10300 [Acidobacteria bacterium]|nr:hypothetical protein [Acidobacteriota bacterium]